MKLTPWYPPHIKPVRVGVYERMFEQFVLHPTLFSYWDGATWFSGQDTEEMALISYKIQRRSYFDVPWRGLAMKP